MTEAEFQALMPEEQLEEYLWLAKRLSLKYGEKLETVPALKEKWDELKSKSLGAYKDIANLYSFCVLIKNREVALEIRAKVSIEMQNRGLPEMSLKFKDRDALHKQVLGIVSFWEEMHDYLFKLINAKDSWNGDGFYSVSPFD